MKNYKNLTILVLTLMLFSCDGKSQNEQAKSVVLENIIEVIDFHSTHRCMTCNAIEANTKNTLNTYFSEELESGKIAFLSVNVDEKKNDELAEKFEAAGTSLFLRVVINNEETIINLTEFAFLKARNQETFSEELRSRIEMELKKL